MNHLNSVLLEGDIVEVVDYPPGVEEAYIVIGCRRSFEKDGKSFTAKTHFTVIVPVASITNNEIVIPWTTIRVVGRLTKRENSVYIVADYVEIKPQEKGS